MRMRAAVLERFGDPLHVTEVDLSEPRAGEALVRLEAWGVSHRHVHRLGRRPVGLRTHGPRAPTRRVTHPRSSGADPTGYAPTVLGHEGAGIVEAVGEGVADVAPGDRVVTLFSPQCRQCVHCRGPRTNLCLAIREQQNRGYLPTSRSRT